MQVSFLNLNRQFDQISGEVVYSIHDIIEKCCFIGGKYVSEFEKTMENYLSVKYALGCSNGTDALVLALKACGIGYGDEVITTPFTFFATAESIASVGAIPVFVDIREDDYNINSDLIIDAITDKTKAILPVHIFGAPCDMDSILKIANEYGLRVIEDAAQAIGSEYKGRKAGTIGDVGCFSFYPTKNLGGAGDGGMCTTNDDMLSIAIKGYKEHGSGEAGAKIFELSGTDQGINGDFSTFENKTDLYNPNKYYNYIIGYNSRLDAVQAAVLSVKSRFLDQYNERRTVIANKYLDGLTEKVKKPRYSQDIKTCWHQFVICTDYKLELCGYLAEKGIGSGTFYPVPLHKQKAFNGSNSRCGSESLAVSERLAQKTVCLPIYPELTDEEVQYVIDAVNGFEAR